MGKALTKAQTVEAKALTEALMDRLKEEDARELDGHVHDLQRMVVQYQEWVNRLLEMLRRRGS